MLSIQYGPSPDAQSMRLVEEPVPEPRAGEILVENHYVGVNRPDLLQRTGAYPPPPDASPVLGLEAAGRIVALGEGVSEWKVGDFVTTLTPGGAYAEYCIAPAGHALPVPEGLTLAEAASLPENWFTVWANLVDLGHLAAGERLLVHGGSSGIGLAAISWANCWGPRSSRRLAALKNALPARHLGPTGRSTIGKRISLRC